jgi:hypothetical protein
MRCFEDDKCEVFEDDSSSEEDDDSSEETINNGTVTIGKKFKVRMNLTMSSIGIALKLDSLQSVALHLQGY